MRCSKCGKEISEQAKFCKYCGTPVQPEKQVSSAVTSLGVSKKNSKKWLIIASIVIGILVLTGVIAFTIKMVGEKDKTAQKVEKPKQEDTVKPEEPAEEIKAETPEQDTYIKAYQEYIDANQSYLNNLQNENMTSYSIVDIQNDNIPEVLLCKRSSFTGETNLLYMGKDGTIKSCRDVSWVSFDQNTGLILSTTGGGHSAFEESIFQYDESTDTYQEIHHGEGVLYSENGDDGDSEMTWDGVSYPTMTEYNAKVSEVFNKDAAKYPDYNDFTYNIDLLQKISYFEE